MVGAGSVVVICLIVDIPTEGWSMLLPTKDLGSLCEGLGGGYPDWQLRSLLRETCSCIMTNFLAIVKNDIVGWTVAIHVYAPLYLVYRCNLSWVDSLFGFDYFRIAMTESFWVRVISECCLLAASSALHIVMAVCKVKFCCCSEVQWCYHLGFLQWFGP